MTILGWVGALLVGMVVGRWAIFSAKGMELVGRLASIMIMTGVGLVMGSSQAVWDHWSTIGLASIIIAVTSGLGSIGATWWISR